MPFAFRKRPPHHEVPEAAGVRGLLLALGALTSFLALPALAQSTESRWLSPTPFLNSWSDGALWSTAPDPPNNGAPSDSSSYSAIIDVTGPNYAIFVGDPGVRLTNLVLDSPNALVRVRETSMTIEGTASLNSGELWVEDGATLEGGQWSTAPGVLDLRSATLDGVQISGDASVSGTARLRNGATLSGTSSIVGDLSAEGVISLDQIAIDLGSSGRIGSESLSELTLGPQAILAMPEGAKLFGRVINQGLVRFSGDEFSFPATPDPTDFGIDFVNEGTMSLIPGARREFQKRFGSGTWTNESSGTIQIVQAELSLGGTGTNRGTIEVTDGSLEFLGDWINDGTVIVEDSDLRFLSALVPADLDGFEFRGAPNAFHVFDEFDLGGASISLDDELFFELNEGSRLSNGVVEAGNRPLRIRNLGIASANPDEIRLEGVTVLGNLVVGEPSPQAFTEAIVGSEATLASNRITVARSARLRVDRSTTFENVVVFLAGELSPGPGVTLSLDPSARIELANYGDIGDTPVVPESTFVNEGTINSNVGLSFFDINVAEFVNRGSIQNAGARLGVHGGNWTNAAEGTIDAGGWRFLGVGGSNAGVIRSTGDFNSGIELRQGWTNTGTLEVVGGHLLLRGPGVHEGNATLAGGSLFVSGTIGGAGTVELLGEGSGIRVNDSTDASFLRRVLGGSGSELWLLDVDLDASSGAILPGASLVQFRGTLRGGSVGTQRSGGPTSLEGEFDGADLSNLSSIFLPQDLLLRNGTLLGDSVDISGSRGEIYFDQPLELFDQTLSITGGVDVVLPEEPVTIDAGSRLTVGSGTALLRPGPGVATSIVNRGRLDLDLLGFSTFDVDSIWNRGEMSFTRPSTIPTETVVENVQGDSLVGGTWRIYDVLTISSAGSIDTNAAAVSFESELSRLTNFDGLSLNRGFLRFVDGAFAPAADFQNEGILIIEPENTFPVATRLTDSGTLIAAHAVIDAPLVEIRGVHDVGGADNLATTTLTGDLVAGPESELRFEVINSANRDQFVGEGNISIQGEIVIDRLGATANNVIIARAATVDASPTNLTPEGRIFVSDRSVSYRLEINSNPTGSRERLWLMDVRAEEVPEAPANMAACAAISLLLGLRRQRRAVR